MRFETVANVALLLALVNGVSLLGCGDSAEQPAASSSEADVPESPASPSATPVEAEAPSPTGVTSGSAERDESGVFMGRVVVGEPSGEAAVGADAGVETSETGGGPLEISPSRVILTGVRGVAPVASTEATLHNAGPTDVTLTEIAVGGDHAALFRIRNAPTLPVTIAAGGDLSLTLELLPNGNLPPAPRQNDGGTALTARLDIASGDGAVTASLHGVVLTTVTHEPTLGQILSAAGIPLNVGLAQNNANPNASQRTATLPRVEAGTDEVAGGLFAKAGPGDVSIDVIARFSPKGPMPFGWYPSGEANTRNEVATMASSPDIQTSDKARLMLPPVTGARTFDPGDQSFGIWVYTDQISQRFDNGGDAANGDYNYSEDGPNSPANVHRTKVYPLKDAAGTAVADSFLLAVEEAANGDYQDYVFVLGNVKIVQ